jgi:serine/threonine protein kinase
MMTGNLPFLANSIPALFLKLQTQEPSPIFGNYNQDLKNLLGQMLKKNPLYRISTKGILNSKLLINFKNMKNGRNQIIPEIQQTIFINQASHPSVSQPLHSLDFPYNNEKRGGIFSFLSKLPISAFTNKVMGKNLKKRNFTLIKFLSFCSSLEFTSKQNQMSSFQFSFKTKRVLVSHLLFALDSSNEEVCWIFEASPDNDAQIQNWICLYEEKSPQEYSKEKSISVQIQNSQLFSSFRFTIDSSNQGFFIFQRSFFSIKRF